MDLLQLNETNEAGAPERDPARSPIRGSSLLLSGRVLALGLNFLLQVLLVRCLATSDYGGWTYALAAVALFQSFAALGLHNVVTRFASIYLEEGKRDKFLGLIVLAATTVVVVGGFIIASLHLFPAGVKFLAGENKQPLSLLFILIFMVPIEAFDDFLIGLFASLSKARAIFFRRYVLTPLLQLVVVALGALMHSGVAFLAYGYLAASIVGLGVNTALMVGVLRQKGLLAKSRAEIDVPAREVFGFTLPLLTSDLVTAVVNSSSTLLLGYYCDIKEVAFFQAVLPVATLNQLVIRSFSMLYTSAASRMFARKDTRGINQLYWRTALWMAVISFPVFAITFSLAGPLTEFLFGDRYQKSGLFLAIVSLGYYFNVAVGFNGITLKVIGRVKYLVTINLAVVTANLLLNLWLIPKYGALGAAVATSVTSIVHNVLKQVGLRFATGINLFNPEYSNPYLIITACGAGLFAFQWLGTSNPFWMATAAGVACLLVVYLCKNQLRVAETFPEILRLPVLREMLT